MEATEAQKVEAAREKRREGECPFRAKGGCEDIRGNLGWNHGVDMNVCDLCWNKGGPEGGASFRDELMRNIVAEFSDPKVLLVSNASVIHAMIRWHLTPDAAKQIMDDPEFDYAVNKADLWAKVKHTWEMAGSFIKSMTSRGVTNRYVELTIKNKRHVSCFGTTLAGEKVGTECRSLRTKEDGASFCGACGCHEASVSRLDGTPYGKLDYPYLECPRQRPGFSNEQQR